MSYTTTQKLFRISLSKALGHLGATTMVKPLLALIFFICAVQMNVAGQVNAYTFAQSTGTYTTVPSPTTVHASGWDDAVSAAITIPFTYTFNGTGYTSCRISTNGFITFGATAPATTYYTPISGTTGYAGAISAMGRDLVSNSSTVVYGVSGSSPNRVFIIQWNNARRYNSTSIVGDFNFQIRLHETTNKAEIMYGACTTSSSTDCPVQVGLRGTANSDYNNRLLANGTGQWSATSNGSANTSTCATRSTSTQYPTNGLTFTWTPPTCSGTPSTPVAAISATSGWGGTAFNLTYTSQGTPVTNQWQTSYDNVNWTNYAGVTYTPVNGISSQSTIYYRVISTCPVSGLTATSNVVSYTVTGWYVASSTTAYACSGIWYDSGASGGSYSDNQDYTYTFYPGVGTTGQKVRLTFSAFSTENNYDGMMIYNGNSTAAPLISSGLGAGLDGTTCPAGSWRGTGTPTNGAAGVVTSTATDGSLTIRFRSDGGTTGTGWAATVSCFNPCTVPTAYTVTGGGNRCTSGAALAIGLSNSQVNVSYQLNRDGIAIGSPVAGTGAALSFTAQTTAGVYTIVASGTGGGFCATGTSMSNSVTITVDPLPVLGTLNNAGPVVTCDHAGNISQVSLSGYTGTPTWEYGTTGGWPGTNWVNGANAGTCCFVPNPGADRIRVYVTSGACGTSAYSSTVLIQNKNAPAPTSLASSATSYCLAAKPTNITLTATFPSSGDMLPTVAGYTSVEFFSGSCGGTSLGTGTISGNTATLTIAAPSATTVYYARSTSSCETSTCAPVTVTVNNVPAQPTGFSGLATPCSGSSQAYSVANVAGVTYTWAFPGSGWNITNGTGTNAITVTVGSGTGNITVTPSNGCGNGTPLTSAVATGAGPTVSVSPSPASACGGTAVTLTASGASTYSWSPATGLSATTGSSVNANPATQTTYTVTETGSGCNNSATVTVKVGPIVTANATASPGAVCPGGAVSLTSSGAEGTATLVSPTGDGGFETGTTFALNSWTAVNAASNIWVVGNLAPAFAGSRGAHISTTGAAYNYSTTVTRTSHLYRDVVVPAGATSISLSFYWKGNGEASWDRLLVYTAPTSVTPAVNVPASQSTTLTGATLVWTQPSNSQSAYTQATIALPNGLAGTTVRLIFTWQNDAADGTSPGAALDNVSVTYTPPAASYTYSWSSSPAGFTSSSQNPTANPTVNTSYTVTVTNTTSGCSDTHTTGTVTMNPVPQGSLTNGGTVCAGEFASLIYTSTSGTGPFTINYDPSGQSASGVASGTPFASDIATSSGTNTYTITSVTDANGCSRSSGFTGPSTSVTGTAAPTVPTSITSTINCTTGATTLTANPAPGAGEAYKWYTVSSGGTAAFTGVTSITVTPVNSTTYYAAKYYTAGGACESPRLGATAWADGLEPYTATRFTGNTFTDISGTGTAVTSWRNGTSTDDLSNTLNIGFNFPFDGGIVSQFRVSVDGYITFNTATNATGAYLSMCSGGDAFSSDNTTFSQSGKSGTLQSIAPFYDDLEPNFFSQNTSMHYQVTGSVGSRVLTVQWRGMSKYVDPDNCISCTGANYNFQVKIYETTGNIEFVYGTMTASSEEDSKNYTSGINSASLTGTLNTAKLFTQQTANTATFGSTAVNNLSTVPATNTRILFTRGTTIAPTNLPECIVYNYPANGATNQCSNATLSWSPVDDQPTSYDVYFGTSSTPPLVATSHTAMFYNPGTLAAGTYYWKIVPKNAVGTATATMPTWSFSVTGANSVTGFTTSNGTKVGNTVNLCAGQSTTITLTGVTAETSTFEWSAPFIFDLGCSINPPYPLLGNCQASSRTFSSLSEGTYEFYVKVVGCNGLTSCLNFVLNVDGQANTAPTSIGSSAGTTICSGTSTVLTPAGGTHGAGSTYEWFTGSCGSTVIATTNTITVSPTNTTTYYVRRTGGTTCGNTTSCTSQTITVQNALGNNTISGTQTICEGASPSTLTGSTPTGGSGAYTYDWQSSTTSSSAGFSTLGSNTINYTSGALSQTTWFKRTVTSGSCTTPIESNVIQVTVTPTVGTPSFSAGATSLCPGGTSTYTASASNGTVTYSILSGGASINSTTGVVSSVTSSFTVRATAAGCNGPTTADRAVTVTPNVGTPSFTAGATTVCIGSTETYTATVSNGTVTYSILSGGASINSSTGQVSSVTSSFTVRATGTGTCGSPTTADRAVTVTPNVGTPSFTAGATTVCIGSTETYTATASNGTVTYSILSGGASINSTTGQVSSVTSSFTVRATATGCNGPTTADRAVTVTPNVTTPSFTAGATTVCIGSTETYTATVSNGTVTYSILSGGASINSTTGQVSSVTSSFTVRATGTGCNGPTTADRAVTVTPNVGTPSFTAGATTVCIGSTETYTATASNGTVTYSILSGGASINSTTGQVSSVTSSFTVRATGTGCNGPTTADRAVTVTPNVGTPSFTAGATTVCIGSTETYTATVSNGTVTYSILSGGASINSTTGQVSSVTSSFTVRATGTGCNGPTTADRAVTVTPNVGTPSFTAGATTVCIGSTETYTATVSNGTVTYSILSGGASINSTTGQVSSVTSSFTVRATGTGCNGPTTADRAVTVTPNVGTPSFTAGATTLCVGGSSTYTATASNGTVTYSILSGGASINSTSGVVSSVTGNFTVRATATGCNGPTTADRAVTVTSPVTPTVSIGANPGTSICFGTNVSFTATPGNGGTTPTYQWTLNGSNAGTGSTYSNSSLAHNDVVAVVMTSNATCVSPTTASDQETITVTQPNVGAINTSLSSVSLSAGDYLWGGNSSTAWGTTSNWYVYNGSDFVGAGSLPTNTTRVFIVTGTVAQQCVSNTNSPTIGAAAESNDITIGTGAVLSVTGGNTLSVYGNWDSRGTFNRGTGVVSFMGAGNKTISSNGNLFYRVYVNKANDTDKITMTDDFESTEMLIISNGIFENPSNLTGKAIRVQIETGAEMKIFSNGEFRTNP